MSDVLILFLRHPMASWLVVAAMFLVVELATMSGWMVWIAASAAMTSLIAWAWPTAVMAQLAAFALTAVASTVAGRRLFGPRRKAEDLDDLRARVVGLAGRASVNFQGREGRVFVDGREWRANYEGPGDPPLKGDAVFVTAIADRSRITVNRSGERGRLPHGVQAR